MSLESAICKITIPVEANRMIVTEEKHDEWVAAHYDIPPEVIKAYKSHPHNGMGDECVSRAVDECMEMCIELAVKEGYKTITREANIDVFYPHKIYNDRECTIDKSLYRVEVECSVGK